MKLDVHQALKEAENSLRDFIANRLEMRFGSGWIDICGVSPERIDTWKDRKAIEAKRQRTGTVEERLLYYADFYDLSTIVMKHWSDESVGFSTAFGKRKTMETFLGELEKLRDPHAHQRELLPHQKHLILGLSGEIRNRIIRYRSKMETSEDYYPRFESVRDNLGNVWVPKGGWSNQSGGRLRVGDTLQFVVSATDPMGETLSYKIDKFHTNTPENWQEDPVFNVDIESEDVRNDFIVLIYIRSPRVYHASGTYDHAVMYQYEVLPPISPL